MKQVKIMRGCSGSGKSTHTRNLVREAKANDISWVVVSADAHFLDEEGNYNFDPSKLGEAHGSCFVQCIDALRNNIGLVIVDNTNTTAVEIAPYMAAAAAYGYDAEILLVEADVDVAIERNVHGVPAEAVKRQAKNIQQEKLPPWWKQTKV